MEDALYPAGGSATRRRISASPTQKLWAAPARGDTARDQVRATVVQASRQLEAARASQPQVTAAEVAFKGVRQGARAAFVRSGSIRSASPHLYAGVKSYSREAKDYDA
jgi:hypothetical protein